MILYVYRQMSTFYIVIKVSVVEMENSVTNRKSHGSIGYKHTYIYTYL